MIRSLRRLVLVAVLALLCWGAPAGAVGFQELSIPDPGGAPLRLSVWSPSDAVATPQPLGSYTQSVAAGAAIAGSDLPLIIISHGTGGNGNTHYDTALALAKAGFVAAAITHTGDSLGDHALSFTRHNFAERPRHIKLAIDYLLTAWPAHQHIAAGQIGALGHSAGGFTVLIAIGGELDPERLSGFCREHSDEWGCERGRVRQEASARPAPAPEGWTHGGLTHDARIKAAVIAAPATGYAFTRDGLAAVTAPVQLWQAEDDRIAANRWSSETVRQNLPSPPETHVVPLAGHFAFLAPCGAALAERAPEICNDTPGFDRAAFHAEFNRAVVEFFRRQLSGR